MCLCRVTGASDDSVPLGGVVRLGSDVASLMNEFPSIIKQETSILHATAVRPQQQGIAASPARSLDQGLVSGLGLSPGKAMSPWRQHIREDVQNITLSSELLEWSSRENSISASHNLLQARYSATYRGMIPANTCRYSSCHDCTSMLACVTAVARSVWRRYVCMPCAK